MKLMLARVLFVVLALSFPSLAFAKSEKASLKEKGQPAHASSSKAVKKIKTKSTKPQRKTKTKGKKSSTIPARAMASKGQ